MDALFIPLGKSTPQVLFRPENNMFIISGNSYPENPEAFFEPLRQWMKEYLQRGKVKSMTIHFELVYFNTSSSKQIIKLLDLLKNKLGKDNVIVDWHYNLEDLDLIEEGKKFETLSGLKFSYSRLELR